MSNVKLILCTFPNKEEARQIGTVLVEKQLAACVNLVSAVESIYRWQGQVETASEVLAIFKTRADVLPAFEEALIALHSYDIPEIIAIDPVYVAEPYRVWLLSSVGRAD